MDLTLVSNNLASKCNWEVWGKSSIGSDHYPIVITLDIETDRTVTQRGGKVANWDKFKEMCEEKNREN